MGDSSRGQAEPNLERISDEQQGPDPPTHELVAFLQQATVLVLDVRHPQRAVPATVAEQLGEGSEGKPPLLRRDEHHALVRASQRIAVPVAGRRVYSLISRTASAHREGSSVFSWLEKRTKSNSPVGGDVNGEQAVGELCRLYQLTHTPRYRNLFHPVAGMPGPYAKRCCPLPQPPLLLLLVLLPGGFATAPPGSVSRRGACSTCSSDTHPRR